MMNNEKKYLGLQEQLDLLKNKGLIIPNEKIAKNKLKELGYYKLINPYRFPFTYCCQDENGNEVRKYIEGITFDYIYALYEFDQSLSAAVLEAATAAEIRFKAVVSDLISRKYGVRETDYLKEENFEPDGKTNLKFKEIKDCITKEINKQVHNRHVALLWYHDHYGYYPFWVVANILTFGAISRIYTKLKDSDKIEIAREFKLQYSHLESFINHLSLIRNVCAHNDVLYRYRSQAIAQKDTKKIYERLGIEKNKSTGRYQRGSEDFLATLITFYYVLPKKNYNCLKTKLTGLLKKLKDKIDQENIYQEILLSMGLVKGWEDVFSKT